MSWIKFPWVVLKLLYLHFVYAFLGMDQEYFYINRGNYFYEIECYQLAIGNYNSALNEHNSKDPYIKIALAYCYSMIGNNEKSLILYQESYNKNQHPDAAIGLICAQLNNGNDEKAIDLLKQTQVRKDELDSYHINELALLEKRLTREGLLKEKNV